MGSFDTDISRKFKGFGLYKHQAFSQQLPCDTPKIVAKGRSVALAF